MIEITSKKDLKELQGEQIEEDIEILDDIKFKFAYLFEGIKSITGELNGNGHTIKNLNVKNEDDEKSGFIRYNDGEVRNLNIRDVSVYGKLKVGGLIGKNDGKVVNCSVTGSIKGEDFVGGLIGDSGGEKSSIINCNASVECTGVSYVGGLIGRS
jgi:hypothetical protein